MSEIIVSLQEISKSYAKSPALKDVSINIIRGRIYGLVGVNGAGKTTMLRVISGLSVADSGVLELFGESSPREMASMRNRIGFLIEKPAYYDNLNFKQNLRIMQMTKKSEENLNEIAELVGIDEKDKRKSISNYSFGMKQRYGIAASLIGSPELLALDEPANGLDPIGIKEMRELLLRLNRDKNITILISSHLLSELWQLATDYIFIHNGIIVENISSADLAEKMPDGGDKTEKLQNYFYELVGSRRMKGS